MYISDSLITPIFFIVSVIIIYLIDKHGKDK